MSAGCIGSQDLALPAMSPAPGRSSLDDRYTKGPRQLRAIYTFELKSIFWGPRCRGAESAARRQDRFRYMKGKNGTKRFIRRGESTIVVRRIQ